MAPKIDDHDIDTKVKAAARFLDEGDKLKVTVRFRGRELAHPDRGRTLLLEVGDKLKDHGTIERMPLLEGRQMIMVMNPVRRDAQTGAPVQATAPPGAAANGPRAGAPAQAGAATNAARPGAAATAPAAAAQGAGPPTATPRPAGTAQPAAPVAPRSAGTAQPAASVARTRPAVAAAPAAPRAPAAGGTRPGR